MATTEVFQEWDNPHDITSISRKTTRTTTRTRTRREVYEDSDDEVNISQCVGRVDSPVNANNAL